MTRYNVGALTYSYQAIDVLGPIDVLNSGSKAALTFIQGCSPIDEALIAHAPDFTFHHIGIAPHSPVDLLGTLTITPTCTVDDCPDLDILILGGPNPNDFRLDPNHAAFIRRHVAAGKLLFTNCTGSYVAALAGVLDGKSATINNLAFEGVKKLFPQVQWTVDTKWVQDGNIWTAAGALAGMDMVSYWLGEKYGKEVVRYAAMMLDYEPRDVNGALSVLPLRYDESGKQLFTHEFKYHES